MRYLTYQRKKNIFGKINESTNQVRIVCLRMETTNDPYPMADCVVDHEQVGQIRGARKDADGASEVLVVRELVVPELGSRCDWDTVIRLQ